MKRICFLTDSIFSFGGVQRVTAVIAKELAKTHHVTIVTFDREDAKDTSLYELDNADISYRFFQYPKAKRLKLLLCKAYSLLYRKAHLNSRIASDLYAHSSFPSELRTALAEELRQGHYDTIIGVHAPLAARLATCRKELPCTKIIGWIHNSYEALFGKGSLYIGPELRRHYEYQLAKLDTTVVLCHDDAVKYHFTTTVIYNPLTLKPGKRAAGNSKKFLAVGRFSHLHKGFDLLIDAFSIFAQQDSEWRLDIVGEGSEESLYRRMIAHYQLENRITLHPFTTNIQKYYSDAQVYVLSSRWEGFGLVLVEAMAHGLPIVSSDLPTSMELMGDFGLYFENGNVNQLAQRLREATTINWQDKSAEAIAIAQHFELSQISAQWGAIL